MITILVVDDEPEIVRISRGYLEQAGYRVLTARDGTTALAAFRQNQPDLVVLDLNLPTPPGAQPLDGLDVARAIRQMPTLARQTNSAPASLPCIAVASTVFAASSC
jgi:CheY-like chemotaxis protein